MNCLFFNNQKMVLQIHTAVHYFSPYSDT